MLVDAGIDGEKRDTFFIYDCSKDRKKEQGFVNIGLFL